MCEFDSWCLEGNPRELEIEPGLNKNGAHFEQVLMDLYFGFVLTWRNMTQSSNLMVELNHRYEAQPCGRYSAGGPGLVSADIKFGPKKWCSSWHFGTVLNTFTGETHFI